MNTEDITLIHTLIHYDAAFHLAPVGGPYPAFAHGDRRTRPVCWIEKHTLNRLVAEGALGPKGGGVKVTPATRHRLTGQDEPPSSYRPDEHRDVFMPSGAMRKAKIRARHNVLLQLSRQRDRLGYLVLSAAEVEAGRRFAEDYERSGRNHVATQNFASAGADNARRHDDNEVRLIQSLDRDQRVRAALAAIGSGLDRAVIAVCCENWTVERLEQAEKWAQKSGLTILKLGLQRLSVFYGTQTGLRKSG